MRPPARPKLDYEKVMLEVMLTGIIEVVQYNQEYKFKGFSGGEDTIQPAVRFNFSLDGYKFPHYSRWMKFTLAEKSNLYKKYVSKLVEDAMPDMDIDLDILNGMKIKTVWSEDGDYQNIDAIYPAGPKIKADTVIAEPAHEEEPPDLEEAPF